MNLSTACMSWSSGSTVIFAKCRSASAPEVFFFWECGPFNTKTKETSEIKYWARVKRWSVGTDAQMPSGGPVSPKLVVVFSLGEGADRRGPPEPIVPVAVALLPGGPMSGCSSRIQIPSGSWAFRWLRAHDTAWPSVYKLLAVSPAVVVPFIIVIENNTFNVKSVILIKSNNNLTVKIC